MTERTLPQTTDAADEAQEERSLRWGRIVLWGVVGLIVIFLAMGLMQAFSTQPTEGKAPDFTLYTYEHGDYTLSELRGQVVVINIWASWCTTCKYEAADLQQAWVDYQDQGVMFLGVDYVDSEEKGLEYIQRYGITYPNGPDLRTEIYDSYNCRGVPETFVINPDGEISFHIEGTVTYDQLTAEIEKAMAQ